MVAWAISIMIVAGALQVLAMTSLSLAVQQRCDPAILGRVMGIWALAFAGSRPIGALAGGLLAEHWTWGLALASAAVFLLVASIGLSLWVHLPRPMRTAGCKVAADAR